MGGAQTMAVILIGTLDTKGVEIQFVRDLLHQAGVGTLVLDAGVLRPPLFAADIGREAVFEAAETKVAALQQAQDRGRAIEAGAKGTAKIVADLYSQGKVDGVL